ncbi:MAG: 30S ribosomal protein S4 [Candidatus Harrisonbacteria bacterium CG10_big_fil_rev_8_21_14_0_10_42_17]|uniref:Small ribosomal subunit protein uS4 n=1 Tax=Candidatus Harrisonbacteria bacterium CG10_big_fil_rev_8_21_14_0_10_42_17 TaxID=1974584 RepID=A0A2M6WI20_9BACT|nr:MAG: 30S ribosomal protein S4 [Candidatus Harrisonbacteria bacterium CG10_big_fil_rev_8_21_14_0_10_42_17]
MFDTRAKKERSLGTNLFLKPHRSATPKSAMIRRPHKPGIHGTSRRRRRLSEYGTQLQEKQKFRFSYGLREKAFRRIVSEAFNMQGVTGELIINLLERRLDNVVYRLGFAPSRSVARQLVSHGHMFVNGRKVTIPSYRTRVGDRIKIRPQSKEKGDFKELHERLKNYEEPGWLLMDKEKLEGSVKGQPKDTEMPFDVNMIVDYYSKIIK